MSDDNVADADWFRFAGWEEGYLQHGSGHHPAWVSSPGAGDFRAPVGVAGLGARWVHVTTDDAAGCQLSVGTASAAVAPLATNPTRRWVRRLCDLLECPVCAEPCPDARDAPEGPQDVNAPPAEQERTR